MYYEVRNIIILITIFWSGCHQDIGPFYFGADQSYVNEMEDCGIHYKENDVEKDVHKIFKDHGCNLVRLRLWHTPSWYDSLNHGSRYCDLEDVRKSIRRVKKLDMEVLLNFHLSDNWADPSKQIIPNTWGNIIDDLPILKDSLYQYITSTLVSLDHDDLLPEMVQIGNETNRPILLSPDQNVEPEMIWERNSALFNAAIRAVRDFSDQIKIAIHFAGPAETEHWVDEFEINGVNDFDIIAVSYYWAWHQPTTIPETGEVIRSLKKKYPEKEVLIVETGYLWTTEKNDPSHNIITDQREGYEPASPENQKRWLVDLTQEVVNSGGIGVVYWEPSWVSSPCRNQWDLGSHQEHATFFDFTNNLIIPGGIEWMEYDYWHE